MTRFLCLSNSIGFEHDLTGHCIISGKASFPSLNSLSKRSLKFGENLFFSRPDSRPSLNSGLKMLIRVLVYAISRFIVSAIFLGNPSSI